MDTAAENNIGSHCSHQVAKYQEMCATEGQRTVCTVRSDAK